MPGIQTKERPILFSPAMAGLVHSGVKTQTRRIVKPQPGPDFDTAFARCCRYAPAITNRDGELDAGPEVFGFADDEQGWVCPYGQPGDRLWVRESFRYAWPPNGPYQFQSDMTTEAAASLAWRPSIHMPRWACRTVVELTDVRVERVEDIDTADAIAEGMTPTWNGESSPGVKCPSEVDQFLHLFYDLNKRAPRDTNPFVWVLTFKKRNP